MSSVNINWELKRIESDKLLVVRHNKAVTETKIFDFSSLSGFVFYRKKGECVCNERWIHIPIEQEPPPVGTVISRVNYGLYDIVRLADGNNGYTEEKWYAGSNTPCEQAGTILSNVLSWVLVSGNWLWMRQRETADGECGRILGSYCAEIGILIREEVNPTYKKRFLTDGNCGEIIDYTDLNDEPCVTSGTLLRETVYSVYKEKVWADGMCGEYTTYTDLNDEPCVESGTVLSEECWGQKLKQYVANGRCDHNVVELEASPRCSGCTEYRFSYYVYNTNRRHIITKQVSCTIVSVEMVPRSDQTIRPDLGGKVCCGVYAGCESTKVGGRVDSFSQVGNTLTINCWVECFNNSAQGCACDGAYTRFELIALCLCAPSP